MSATATRKIYTRHIGLSITGILSGIMTVLGMIQQDLPTITQYLTVTAIPNVITIADFVMARIKDGKGLNGITMADVTNLISEVKQLRDKFPQLSTLVPVNK